MDFPISSMFSPISPQHEKYQILTKTSSTTSEAQHDQIIPTLKEDDDLETLLLQISSFTEDHPVEIDDFGLQRKASLLHDHAREDDITANPNNNDMKKKQKVVHREIERQRRLEMSTLHASLRTLLPHEYIKGKRSMSDHLNEAVNYIQHLQNNIKALSNHRDGLKKQVNTNTNVVRDRDVRVKPCKGGVDIIVVSTNCDDSGDQGLPLSKVLKCLAQEGLGVVSCISNRVDNSKFVHSIQAQIADEMGTAVDATKLQQKLTDI